MVPSTAIVNAPRDAQPLRLLAVADWSFSRTPTPTAEEPLAALRRGRERHDLHVDDSVQSRLGFVRLAAAIAGALRRQRYDAIMPLYGSLTALLCALVPGVPLVAAFAGTDINGELDEAGRPLVRALFGVALSQLATLRAVEVVVPVPSMVPRLWSAGWRARVHVIPAGVDTRRFVPLPQAEARDRLGLDPAARLVGFAALDPDARVKRRDLAEAAVARLPASLGARLQVITDVAFEELPRWYAACNALVVTSDLEGGPVVVKEALACGLPVVGVDCGDVAEVIAGLDHCAIAARDPAALAAALAPILEERARCAAGPARIAARYGLDAMGERYRAVVERAAGQRRPAR
ncbi:MAG: glycosyltransferase [Deltaproteobacteria bacterium]|nr:glycosyltransferase [Deltaproteobacteria bacterium]